MTGDAQLAADLCQETFVAVIARLGQVSDADKPGAWLHTVAINLWRNHRAKTERRKRLDTNAGGGPSTLQEADSTTREREMIARLDDALAKLTSEQREAFVIRVIERVPLEQAAEMLGVPRSTISHRAQRAEQVVRGALEDDR